MLKVSYHAHQRRNASYSIIRREVVNGFEVESDLARTLLDRADNRRFKEGKDKFVIRKDLLGMYILTRKSHEKWIVVTHIDLSDGFRQRLLKKLFPREEAPSGEGKQINKSMSVSNAILTSYDLEEINKIKERAEIEIERFEDTYSFPCIFRFEVDLDGVEHAFQVSKSSAHKVTKLSMIS